MQDKLHCLRQRLGALGADGMVVPVANAYLTEPIADADQRLRWLSGFGGSAGLGVVLRDQAVLVVDGRYVDQARAQADAAWHLAASLKDAVPARTRLAYDPWLHSMQWVSDAAAGGIELLALAANPIDALWQPRPLPIAAPMRVHPLRYAGRDSASKRAQAAAALAGKADCVIIAALDSIAWLLNVRGGDVGHAPLACARLVLHADTSVDLFAAPGKIDAAVRAHLGADVRLHDEDRFLPFLRALRGRIMADPLRTPAAIGGAIAGAQLVLTRDPVLLPKSIKNASEVAGQRAAHLRDGLALTRFLCWLAHSGPTSEQEAARQLLSLRQHGGLLQDLAFPTISASGAHAALPHYAVDPAAETPMPDDTLYLCDSGGQYLDGTTDVTRTVAIGTPTAEMCERYTCVLRGHIALARAVFPAGTHGNQLDVLARRPLWEAGLDFAHSTGHGVGAYLCVHEGPIGIKKRGGDDEALQPGMIVSNEPAYYKAGEYGIRIENLVLVVALDLPGAEQAMLGFDTLTVAPFARALIDSRLLDAGERAWVDAYHQRVLGLLQAQVPSGERDWLAHACSPLD